MGKHKAVVEIAQRGVATVALSDNELAGLRALANGSFAVTVRGPTSGKTCNSLRDKGLAHIEGDAHAAPNVPRIASINAAGRAFLAALAEKQ